MKGIVIRCGTPDCDWGYRVPAQKAKRGEIQTFLNKERETRSGFIFRSGEDVERLCRQPHRWTAILYFYRSTTIAVEYFK